jgi:hypothetical protein
MGRKAPYRWPVRLLFRSIRDFSDSLEYDFSEVCQKVVLHVFIFPCPLGRFMLSM